MVLIRRAVMAAVSAALLAAAAPGIAAAADASPAGGASCRAAMSSTFLQPSFPVFAWDAARYGRELSDMKAVGIGSVIDQWTVDMDAGLTHYPSPPGMYQRGPDMVSPLIAAADRQRVSVWLGLGNVYAWQSHATDLSWLQNQLYIDMKAADQLYALYPGRIKGWYISNEVDDVLLSNPAALGPMRSFFTELAGYLHSHDGNLAVMASPTYSGLNQSPAEFARGVKDVLGALDVVNVQDGGGSGYIAPSDITNWFRALSGAFAGTRTAVWSDADMFASPSGPMPPAQLQSNLNATCGLVASRSGFSFTTQMSPASLGTSTYYDAYRSYLRSR